MPVFFIPSRRRNTRCLSDWSSDVCSSDLDGTMAGRQDCDDRRVQTILPSQLNPLLEEKPCKFSSHVAEAGEDEDRKSVVEGRRGDIEGWRVVGKDRAPAA